MLLLYIFLGVVIINAGYFLLFSKFTFLKSTPPGVTEQFPVSVIICAKNEAANLKEHIPLWLAQDYPNFELILINDASTDETEEVIEHFSQNDARVHTVQIENTEAFWSNKKYSLTLGIKRAVHGRMLFTDADCKPASTQWITQMTGMLSNEHQLVLGYGTYEKTKGVLNALIRYETMMTAIQYFSYATAGMPYMGVGRNLSYTSTLFYKNSGFMSHMNIPSGDDDLFVNEAATTTNTAINFHPQSHTISIPKKTLKEWFQQKRRHITTAQYYKPKHRTLLGVYYVSNLLFWTLLPFCFIFLDWKMPLGIALFRFLLQYIFIGQGTKTLQEKGLLPFLAFLEFFLVVFHLTIFISNLVAKPKRWK